ncbi:MAG: hypothetical protein LBT38_02355 [Deltaproteobacteria bacterium]|nr:hypothetical protein [Deltaproteobacteria bacterium]
MKKLLGAFLLVGLVLAQNPAWGAQNLGFRDFIWWRLISQSQSPDGGHLIVYQLESQAPDYLDDLEVTFKLSPYQRLGGVRAYLEGSYFRKIINSKQRRFVFYGGQSAKLDIWAKARRGDKWLTAQTIASTFGQSGLTDPEATPLEDKELAGPQWTLAGSERFYRAQTGQLFELELSLAPTAVKIFEDLVTMANLRPSEKGLYRHVSQQTQDQAQSGYTASKKDLVFVGYWGETGAASFSLPVYRAYYGQLDYPKGFLVMGVFLLGTIGLVKAQSRRFESQ